MIDSFATIRGHREYQEDRYFTVSLPGGTLMAVMDGHGGDETAEYVKKHLPGIWVDIFSEGSPAGQNTVKQTMLKAVAKINEETKCMDAGATLSMVFIPYSEDIAYIAILGDSPVIVQTQDGTLHLSPDHKVRSNATEYDAAQARGAYVYGGYMSMRFHGAGIQMTRVLGDAELDPIINREPEVYSMPLGDFLIVGTDGLLDPSHAADPKKQCQRFAEMVKSGFDATGIVNSVQPPIDNITAILWKRASFKLNDNDTE